MKIRVFAYGDARTFVALGIAAPISRLLTVVPTCGINHYDTPARNKTLRVRGNENGAFVTASINEPIKGEHSLMRGSLEPSPQPLLFVSCPS